MKTRRRRVTYKKPRKPWIGALIKTRGCAGHAESNVYDPFAIDDNQYALVIDTVSDGTFAEMWRVLLDTGQVLWIQRTNIIEFLTKQPYVKKKKA